MNRTKATFNGYRHGLRRGLIQPKPSRRAVAAGNAFLAPEKGGGAWPQIPASEGGAADASVVPTPDARRRRASPLRLMRHDEV